MAWFLADKYLFKVNNRNSGKTCETSLKVDNKKKKQKTERLQCIQKICGRQSLKNSKGYGLLKQIIYLWIS